MNFQVEFFQHIPTVQHSKNELSGEFEMPSGDRFYISRFSPINPQPSRTSSKHQTRNHGEPCCAVGGSRATLTLIPPSYRQPRAQQGPLLCLSHRLALKGDWLASRLRKRSTACRSTFAHESCSLLICVLSVSCQSLRPPLPHSACSQQRPSLPDRREHPLRACCFFCPLHACHPQPCTFRLGARLERCRLPCYFHGLRHFQSDSCPQSAPPVSACGRSAMATPSSLCPSLGQSIWACL